MSDIVKQLLLQAVLILLNAFFAATEIAVISLNEKNIHAVSFHHPDRHHACRLPRLGVRGG